MRAFVFPGQGAQRVGMGGELFDQVAEYAAIESKADALVGYSIRELCLHGDAARLGATLYTQPCLYVVNALHYYNAVVRQGMRPDYLAGHSLGEYNALLAAGCFDLLTGLQLVKKRAELMTQAGRGSMAAIVGLELARVSALIEKHELREVDVANVNTRVQVVISGPEAEIERAVPIFEREGAGLCVTLAVSGAFHSRHMRQVAGEFAEFLESFAFNPPQVTIVSNVTAQPYSLADPANNIKRLLVRQICEPVQWLQSVRWLLAQGVTEFMEVGPGRTLTRITDQIRREG